MSTPEPGVLGDPAAARDRPSPHEERLLAPIRHTGRGFRVLVVVLALITAWGATAWIWQIIHGLGVTGMNRPVYWGIYITNFVFFIGISHAGTLISAILRLTGAEWRRSITRMAEVITVLVIAFGAGNVVVDMGRPDRVLNVIYHGNFRSPLLWDVCSISVYLIGSTTYLFLPMLPDLVLLEKRFDGWRQRLYRFLRLGYTDTPAQRKKLERAIAVLAVVVIPIAVSVHTVVSWVFAMTIQPTWHSSIFGPYFVAGAIFSGIAAILTFMVVLRKVYRLEAFIKPLHFDYLGRLLLVMTILWLYFTFAEYITVFYGGEPGELGILHAKFVGRYAIPFWTMVGTCFVVPFLILTRGKLRRSPAAILVASISVNIGMYLERYTIVVPTLVNPRLHLSPVSTYQASWVEWSILAACASGFVLLYVSFTKLFPIVAIWEIEEGIEHGAEGTRKRVSTYFPAPSEGEAP